MKAIILAAGMGNRLKPVTDNRPKPIVEIAGKSSLRRLIEIVTKIGIKKIIIVIGNKSSQIKKHLEDLTNLDIEFVTQEQQKGTGDAINTGLIDLNSDALVLNGDIICSENKISEAYKKFKEQGANTSLIMGYKVKDPENFGVLITKNGKLQKIIEKPKKEEIEGIPGLINAGIYFFRKSALQYFDNIEPSSRGEYEATWVVDRLIEDGHDIFVSETNIWFDVGYPWHLLNANKFLLNQEMDKFEILGKVEENVTIIGKVHIGKNTRIRSGAYIEGPVYIDENADIGPNCYIRPGTYLGKNTRVGNACEIKNSIIFNRTKIGHLSYIGDCIFGEDCNIGAGTISANLRHDKKNIKVTTSGKRISSQTHKLGAIAGDNVIIGIKVGLMPGVKISSNAMIEPGIILSRDV